MTDDHFSPTNEAQSPPTIHRPIPRRNFDAIQNNEYTEASPYALPQVTPPLPTYERRLSSDFLAQLNVRLLRTFDARAEEAEEKDRDRERDRNRSFLNLNSSTLSGIYEDVGSDAAGERSVAETPWDSGAETPGHSVLSMPYEMTHGSPDAGLSLKQQVRRGTQYTQLEKSFDSRQIRHARQGGSKYIILLGKLAALYLFGGIYGVIVSHLHETRQLATIHFEGVGRRSSLYLVSWGLFGVALGSLLPYVDLIWGSQQTNGDHCAKSSDRSESPISEQINDIVRSVGAFVGIAFAIRRLPWQSTLQLTLTLALVNPVLWYILDRSKPGLSFSLIVTSVLTFFIFLANPGVLPSPSLPATTNITRLPGSTASISSSPVSNLVGGRPVLHNQELFAGVVSYDNLAVVTWVGSVLFCSCVCFGSIGRRLAVLEDSGWKRS